MAVNPNDPQLMRHILHEYQRIQQQEQDVFNSAMEDDAPVDLVKYNGVWMTPEEAAHHRARIRAAGWDDQGGA